MEDIDVLAKVLIAIGTIAAAYQSWRCKKRAEAILLEIRIVPTQVIEQVKADPGIEIVKNGHSSPGVNGQAK